VDGGKRSDAPPGRFGDGISDALGSVFGTNNAAGSAATTCRRVISRCRTRSCSRTRGRSPRCARSHVSARTVESGRLPRREHHRSSAHKGGRVHDRWSLVVNKFGASAVNRTRTGFPDSTGFAELWLGPKWTFLPGRGQLHAGRGRVCSSRFPRRGGRVSKTPWAVDCTYVSYATNFSDSSTAASTSWPTPVLDQHGQQAQRFYWLSATSTWTCRTTHKFYRCSNSTGC